MNPYQDVLYTKKPATSLYHHIRAYQDSSTYAIDRGCFKICTNHGTPCSILICSCLVRKNCVHLQSISLRLKNRDLKLHFRILASSTLPGATKVTVCPSECVSFPPSYLVLVPGADGEKGRQRERNILRLCDLRIFLPMQRSPSNVVGAGKWGSDYTFRGA